MTLSQNKKTGFVNAWRIVGLAALVCALTGHASVASGQVLAPPPPAISMPDARGVDVLSGAFMLSTQDLSIGKPGSGGMVYARSFAGTGWRDSVTGTITGNANSSSVTVSFGGTSANFTCSNGACTDADGQGSILTYDPSSMNFTFTSRDGAVATFSNVFFELGPFQATLGQISSVRYPNGEIDTYSYKTISLCGSGGVGCSNYIRIQSVTNNLGYQLKLNYLNNSPVTSADAPAWQTVTSVIGINNAVDYCDPTADTCSNLSQSWPTAYYVEATASSLMGTVTDTTQQNVTRYTYDSNFHIIGIKRPSSSTDTTTIHYNGSGQVSQYINGARTWTYNYTPNSSGVPTTTVTDSLGYARVVTNPVLPLTAITDTDENYRARLYQYDQYQRLTSVTQPEGDKVTYTYDGRGNIVTTTLTPKTGSGSIVTTANYDTTCTYPAKCNKTNSTTTANGVNTNINTTTTYIYDNDDTTDTDGHLGLLTKVTSPPPTTGAVQPQTRLTYSQQYAWYKNSSGSIAQATTPVYVLVGTSSCVTTASCAGTADEATTAITYGASGVANNLLPTSVTKGAGDGSLKASDGTAGFKQTFTYDPQLIGNVTAVTGPVTNLASTSNYVWDADRRLTMAIQVADLSGNRPATQYSYTLDSQVRQIDRGTTTYSDGSHFQKLETATVQYDPTTGDPIQTGVTDDITGATLGLTQSKYDADRRLLCVAVRMNPPAVQDACLQSTQGSNGPDLITQFDRWPGGQVEYEHHGVGTSLAQFYARYDYTVNEKISQVTDVRQNAITLAYDSYDRPSVTGYPDGTSETNNSYDADGNVLTWTNRGGYSVVMTYDALDRLQTMQGVTNGTPNQNGRWWDIANRTFAYDLMGHVTSAISDYALLWNYDAAGRLLNKYDNWEGWSYYSYDEVGDRVWSYQPDGYQDYYYYDGLHRPTQAWYYLPSVNGWSQVAGVSYDPYGRRSAITFGDNSTQTYGYDADDRVTSIAHVFPSQTASNVTFGYTYDAAGRAVSRTTSNSNYIYTPTAGSTTYQTATGTNRYPKVGAQGYTYWPEGPEAYDGQHSFYYDELDHLAYVGGSTDGERNYLDALGRRYAHAYAVGANGVSLTDYIQDGNRPEIVLEGVYNWNGSSWAKQGNRRFILGTAPDERWAFIDVDGSVRYPHSDRVGATIALSTSATVGTFSYGAFGENNNNITDQGPGATSYGYRFTGQRQNAWSGLSNFKAREYNPTIGRFLQPDPAGLSQGPNMLGYAGNDPINWSDPSGRDAVVQVMGRFWCGLAQVLVDHPSDCPSMIQLRGIGDFFTDTFGLDFGAAGSGGNSGGDQFQQQLQQQPCNQSLLNDANGLRKLGYGVSAASAAVEVTGVVVAVGDLPDPPADGLGVAIATSGGVGGIAGGLVDLSGAVLQGAQTGNYSEARKAADQLRVSGTVGLAAALLSGPLGPVVGTIVSGAYDEFQVVKSGPPPAPTCRKRGS